MLPFLPKFTVRAGLAACLASLTFSCLTPPDAKRVAASGAQTEQRAQAIGKLREFSHSSAELLKVAGLGWNVGNSLDVPDGETAWGNPRISQSLLNGVAKAGFGLVRIPVTWTRHTGPAPSYTIEASWLERVEEVVGYARAAGLYAIINVHHDGADGFKGAQWLSLKDEAGNTTGANNGLVKARFTAVWTQIAKHFAAAGEELLFESMNEVHDGYGAPDPRHMEFINQLNQEFVNVVRNSGGNNAQRHLVVPGYNTNIDHTITGFKAPSDPTPNRLILTVHFYDPYTYALLGQTHTWGQSSPGRDDWGQEDFVVKQFDRLKTTFIDKGLPVLIGEYGASHQKEFEDYQRYYVEYVTKAAIDRGILPVYWDNGARGSGGEKFGIIDRNNNQPVYAGLMKALKRAAKDSYSLDQVPPPKASQ